MEYDPPSKKKPSPGDGAGDGLIDLPLGRREPDRRPPIADTQPVKPIPQQAPGEMGEAGTTPRHQQTGKRHALRSGSAARRKRKVWPWWLLLLLVAAGGGYWFFFRPPVAVAGLDVVDFAPTRVGLDGEGARVEVFNRGRLPLEVSTAQISGDAGEDFAVSDDGCTGTSLRRDDSCTIGVSFAPEAAGPRRAMLEVLSNAQPLSVTLAGSGLAPSLAVERASLDFQRVAVGKTSEAVSVGLSNTGSAPLEIARVAVEGRGESSFVWVANQCSGATLQPGDSCTVRLAFRPRDTGSFEAELRARSDAPEDPRVALSGVGVAPGLLILPSSLDFGELRPGQSTESRSVQFENTGNATLEIQRVELGGANAGSFEVTANNCDGRTLAAADTCTVAVRYQPGDPARHQATLRVRASGLRRRREVALEGAALAPRFTVSASMVDFGQVIEYATNESALELRNTGSAPLDLSAVEIDGGAGAFGISRGCPKELAPGATCALNLRFSPSRAGGVEGRLRVVHNAPGSPAEVRLLGTGAAAPKGEMAIEPTALEFGSLPIGERSDILTIKVRSVGSARLDLGGYELVGPDVGGFRIVPASCERLSSLLPGSDCTIGVRFRPQGSGPSNAKIVVRHSGGTLEVTLSGEGF